MDVNVTMAIIECIYDGFLNRDLECNVKKIAKLSPSSILLLQVTEYNNSFRKAL